MITFVCCLIALIVGYFIYGKFIERIFGIDAKRQTPAYTHQDGVDYIPMPTWKVFMIQFLNIAGLGPIFGAIMGAKFGTASFLWIVLGSIFAGSVHDYLSGMLSLRHNGESLPEIIGRYLGVNFKQFMRGFTVILMVLVGSVFVAGPAGLLAKLTPEHLDTTFWIIVVFLYYILATLLPVDKIIGKIYPLFAAALLFMAIGILVMLFVNHPPLPEITDGMPNTYPGHLPIFPIMFVSIACGAISGFHATQSPLMARCIKNEKYGRPIFFGSMITEGIVALIWAAAATYFYHNNGKRAVRPRTKPHVRREPSERPRPSPRPRGNDDGKVRSCSFLLFPLHLDVERVAVVAFETGLRVHAVAVGAPGLAAVREVRIGIHLFRALRYRSVGFVAGKARFLCRGLHLTALVTGVARKARVGAGGLRFRGRRGSRRTDGKECRKRQGAENGLLHHGFVPGWIDGLEGAVRSPSPGKREVSVRPRRSTRPPCLRGTCERDRADSS